MNTGLLASAALSLGVLSAGCTAKLGEVPEDIGAETPSPPASTGRLTVRWALEGSKDPSACTLSGVATIRITPFNSVGKSVGEFAQDCTAFSTSIELPPGDYRATALLANASGEARTTTITLDPFTLVVGGNLVMDVDFPASSFLR